MSEKDPARDLESAALKLAVILPLASPFSKAERQAARDELCAAARAFATAYPEPT